MALSGKGLSNRTHTCVVFGGWGGPRSGGREDIPYNVSGAARFAERVKALGLTVKDWQGALDSAEMMESALTFVREKSNPKGKLIVYGYSAGGANALDLARELERRKQPSPNLVIDLLITIDAYRSGITHTDRRVPNNVARSINIFQKYAQFGTGSYGGPSWRESTSGYHDCNQDRSDRKPYKELGRGAPGGGAHGFIDEDTDEVVFEKVEALISGGPGLLDCNLK